MITAVVEVDMIAAIKLVMIHGDCHKLLLLVEYVFKLDKGLIITNNRKTI